MKYLIIASGSLGNPEQLNQMLSQSDRVICADGGTRHLRRVGVLPDLVIGDFDSLSENDKRCLAKNRITMIKHPTDKDAGDTELAARWAMENQATQIILMGVTGTRLDHTLANITLLKTISDRGIRCCILDDTNEIHLVTEQIELRGEPGELVSVIPMTEEASGVTLTGLFYPLEDATLTLGSSLGISNRFIGNKAVISVKRGILVVTKSRD